MASSLGGAFGVAISATVYGAIAAVSSVEVAATGGIIANVIFGILSIISIIALVPKDTGKTTNEKATKIDYRNNTEPEPSH